MKERKGVSCNSLFVFKKFPSRVRSYPIGRHWLIGLLLGVLGASGCAAYTTPAAGVHIPSMTDEGISELMEVKPTNVFPSRIAITRVQSPGYVSRTNYGYGSGAFSVVTVRDIEQESDFERIATLEMIDAVAPINRLLLPANLDSIKDLRLAAARLKADLILIYSIDTAFHVEGTPLGPLSLVTLGFLPNKEAFVTSTTSGVLVDVRSGYVYGVAEATDKTQQMTTIWGTQDAIDAARLETEASSFKSFIGEFEKLWDGLLREHLPSASVVVRQRDVGGAVAQ